MSQPQVKWGQARKYFIQHGYTIVDKGGDKVIKAPPGEISDGIRSRPTVRIGHRYTNHAGDVLSEGHIAAIRRAFGVTREQMLEA